MEIKVRRARKNGLKKCFIGKLKVKKNLPKEVFIFKRGS
jgi:hypothetical protein